MYHTCNFVILTALTCAANIEQVVTPWCLAVYIIGDTCAMLIWPSLQKNCARRNQMLTHHVCTAVLCLSTALGGMVPHAHTFTWFVNLEISSLCLMARRTLRVPYVTELVWIFTRLVYFPHVLFITEAMEFPNMSPVAVYTNRFAAWYIFFLGVAWTMEMIQVRVNPLVITALASFMPIRHAIHVPLAVTSTLHHTLWGIGNLYHVIDVHMVRLYTIWALSTCWRSPIFWVCLLTVSRLGTRTGHVTDRSWDNVYKLIPHALSHYVAGLGVFLSKKGDPSYYNINE